RVGGGIDHPVGWGQRLEIARRPEVAVKEFDPPALEIGAIGFTAGPDEIIEAGHLMSAAVLRQRPRQGAADKTADARNQDAHSQPAWEKEGGREARFLGELPSPIVALRVSAGSNGRLSSLRSRAEPQGEPGCYAVDPLEGWPFR